jgi:hypothetical protein
MAGPRPASGGCIWSVICGIYDRYPNPPGASLVNCTTRGGGRIGGSMQRSHLTQDDFSNLNWTVSPRSSGSESPTAKALNGFWDGRVCLRQLILLIIPFRFSPASSLH